MTVSYQELAIEAKIDAVIRKYRTTDIVYYPYSTGSLDIYKQRTKTFGTGVTLVGRAILNPTKESVSIIGNNEEYDIAFLFSRLELVSKFPTATEGEWIAVEGEIEWWDRRFRIVKVHPSGQIGERFLLTVALANSIPGERD